MYDHFISADIILIAEFRLKESDIDSDFSLPGYNLFRNDQKHIYDERPTHGLLSYVKQSFNSVTAVPCKSEPSTFSELSPCVSYQCCIPVLY